VAAELLITLLVCACCWYAASAAPAGQRSAAILVVCAVVLMQSGNLMFGVPFCLCCAYALRSGGAPERITAAIFLVAVVLTHYAGARPGAGRWTSVEAGILAIDIAALVGWTLVALHAHRFWPIWFAALHALAVAGHAIKMADPELMRWGYAFAIAFWSYPMLLVLACGTWSHCRRLSRRGGDPDWSRALLRGGTVEAADRTA
jgi:hypothetical protein